MKSLHRSNEEGEGEKRNKNELLELSFVVLLRFILQSLLLQIVETSCQSTEQVHFHKVVVECFGDEMSFFRHQIAKRVIFRTSSILARFFLEQI